MLKRLAAQLAICVSMTLLFFVTAFAEENAAPSSAEPAAAEQSQSSDTPAAVDPTPATSDAPSESTAPASNEETKAE